MASKFDWLHPSRIKDANGRRPNNPLYDKRTLYIPPDVLRTMPTSQKEYWSVKSLYMDVIIFFIVVSFCNYLLLKMIIQMLDLLDLNSFYMENSMSFMN